MKNRNVFLISALCCLISWPAGSVPVNERPTEEGTQRVDEEVPGARQSVRPPAVAGQFYPGDPEILQKDVDRYLAQAPSHKLPGRLIALLVPHAGYEYSGAIAAEGFKTLAGNYSTFVLVGTAHHVGLKGAALIAHGSYRTPLGSIPIDEELAAQLLHESSAFEDRADAQAAEHSIEVELPFLQRRFHDFKIVPIVMNNEDPAAMRPIGEAIARAIKGKNIFLIISSDLSHYPPKDISRLADLTFLKALKRLDPDYLALTAEMLVGRRETGLVTAACGLAAIEAGMTASIALGADHAVLLNYTNTGEVMPEAQSRSVGYGAVALVSSGTLPRKTFALDKSSRTQLLEAARDSIAQGLNDKPYAPSPLAENSDLNLPAAVFVTLTELGRLRGCIGTTLPQGGLLDSIRYFARQAAFDDPRFRSLEKKELPQTHIEISILSSPERIRDDGAIIPSKHGVIVRKGNQTGLFLPTVWEQIPDKSDFLSELCEQKAGLPRDCWKDPQVELQVFTSEVFGEPKLPKGQ
jgi:AmmeMemoRadiSam system protein B/AmmeMemoRadiSam system protein A